MIANKEPLIKLWRDSKSDDEAMFIEDEWQDLEDLAQYLIKFEEITEFKKISFLQAKHC